MLLLSSPAATVITFTSFRSINSRSSGTTARSTFVSVIRKVLSGPDSRMQSERIADMSLSKMSGSETVSAEVPAIFSSHPANSGMELKMMSAPLPECLAWNEAGGHRHGEAACGFAPARTPSGAFSTTMHSSARLPAIAAPFRYGSGFGLPWVTSLAVILRPGGNTPG